MQKVKLLATFALIFFAVAVYAGPKESELRTDQLKNDTEELEPGTETETAGKGEVMRTFSDSDGTGWTYCSGKCNMRTQKIKRAGGGTDKVLRIKNVNCTCDCVLFNNAGAMNVVVEEIDGKEGYHNIGPNGNPKDYSIRCCEKS